MGNFDIFNNMGHKFIITEEEKLSIEKLYGIVSEQTSDMLTVEKVIEAPNTPQTNLFNSLKSNRELFRNGSLQNEVNGQQLKVEKKILPNSGFEWIIFHY